MCVQENQREAATEGFQLSASTWLRKFPRGKFLESERVSEETSLYAHPAPVLFLDVHFGQCWRQDKNRVWVGWVWISVVVELGEAGGALETTAWQLFFLRQANWQGSPGKLGYTGDSGRSVTAERFLAVLLQSFFKDITLLWCKMKALSGISSCLKKGEKIQKQW